MQLIGKLKEKVAKTKGLGEARDVIMEAGMRLTDEELVSVVGGGGVIEEWIEHDPTELDFGGSSVMPGTPGSPI